MKNIIDYIKKDKTYRTISVINNIAIYTYGNYYQFKFPVNSPNGVYEAAQLEYGIISNKEPCEPLHNFDSAKTTANIDYKTLFELSKFMSKSKDRYYLNGIYFNAKLPEAAATNGHILLIKDIDIIGEESFILPAEFINLALKLKCKEYQVNLHNDDYITIKCDNVIITCKALDGIFPDYRRVIPKNYSKSIDWVNPLTSANVKSFYKYDRAINNKTTFSTVKITGNKLTHDIGYASILPDGLDITVLFKAEYLVLIPDGIMFYDSEREPFLIETAGSIYVIMPCL